MRFFKPDEQLLKSLVEYANGRLIIDIGGGLLEEGLTRDTDRWAVKVSHVEINSEPINVQKNS